MFCKPVTYVPNGIRKPDFPPQLIQHTSSETHITSDIVESEVKGKEKMIFASNPTPKNVYLIGGLQLEFPYERYGSQFAFMARVISTLNLTQKEGHCHALLESPSGTGKSLSLLCSSLAWQHHYKSQHHHLKPASEATNDPLALVADLFSRRFHFLLVTISSNSRYFLYFYFC